MLSSGGGQNNSAYHTFQVLTIFVLIFGLTDNACPVHASNAFLCATIQSFLPSKCTTDIDVMGDFVETSAVIGLVEEICLGEQMAEICKDEMYFLVKEWNANRGASEGFEEGESRDGLPSS